MSALYGTLAGDGRAKPQTRCAHRVTEASAQSHSGSVTVQLTLANPDAIPDITIMVGEGSRTGGRTVLSVPLSELLKCKALKVTA